MCFSGLLPVLLFISCVSVILLAHHCKMAAHSYVHGVSIEDNKTSPYNANPEKGPPSQTIEVCDIGSGDTVNDVSDMRRLGKRQVFKVDSQLIHIHSLDQW
jgi:hypothetical protein